MLDTLSVIQIEPPASWPQGAQATVVQVIVPVIDTTLQAAVAAAEALIAALGVDDIDGLIAALESKVDKTGGTMTGPLVLSGAPTLGLHAVTKTYADGLIAAADAMVFKGVIDASGNPNYPAADRGWTYRVSVAGKIGGASGVVVEVGDLVLCLTDGTAGGNQAAVGASWNVIQANLDGAVIGPASVTDDLPAVFDGATGNLIKSKSYAAFKTLLALVKADVGLGSVDNTSDAGKPVSTAQQTALDLKASLASPSFSGAPTAPTAALGTNTTQIATMAALQAAVAALVDSSPGTLDTLNELAAALGDDPNFATTVATSIAGKQPLDATLTALSGLTTTSAGRALLAVASDGQIPATATNDSAAAGKAGEFLRQQLLQGAATALTNAVVADFLSQSLTAGDWEVTLTGYFIPGAATNITQALLSLGTTATTFNGLVGFKAGWVSPEVAGSVPGAVLVQPATIRARFSLAATTTIYANAYALFTAGTLGAFGAMDCRRVR